MEDARRALTEHPNPRALIRATIYDVFRFKFPRAVPKHCCIASARLEAQIWADMGSQERYVEPDTLGPAMMLACAKLGGMDMVMAGVTH